MMVWVWPPQISISTQGRVVHWTISAAKARAMRWSRYSSMYFIERIPGKRATKLLFCRRQFGFQRSHLLQKLVCALGFQRVHLAYGEANMNHHIVTLASLGNEDQGYLAHDPAELHASRAHLTYLL